MVRPTVLGTGVDAPLSRLEVESRLKAFLHTPGAHHVVTANVEMYYQAAKDPTFRKVIESAELIITDSVGILWALSMKNIHTDLYPGVEIAQWLLSMNLSVYVLGAEQKVLDRLVHPAIVGKRNGYFTAAEEAEIVADIRAKNPQVLFVAMGARKQEEWIARNAVDLNVPIMIGIGGAVDIISGAKRRAPRLFQYFRLEWLHRLLTEPSRWRRQLVLLWFLGLVLKDKYFVRRTVN